MPRMYHSPRRADAAVATRSAILSAARSLFLAQGFAGTTVPQIARAARVAVPTVYASTGGKADILAALLDEVLDDPAVAEAVTSIDTATDAAEVVRVVAEGARLNHEHHWDTAAELFPQAEFEPTAAASYERVLGAYRGVLDRAAARLAALDALPPGTNEQDASDILWFFLGPEAWLALCKDRGWPLRRAAGWLTEGALAALVDSGGRQT